MIALILAYNVSRAHVGEQYDYFHFVLGSNYIKTDGQSTLHAIIEQLFDFYNYGQCRPVINAAT
jgi:hypothetical protein